MWDNGYGASFWVWRFLSFSMCVAIVVGAVILLYYFFHRISRRSENYITQDARRTGASGNQNGNQNGNQKTTSEQRSKILTSLQSIQEELRNLKKKK